MPTSEVECSAECTRRMERREMMEGLGKWGRVVERAKRLRCWLGRERRGRGKGSDEDEKGEIGEKE